MSATFSDATLDADDPRELLTRLKALRKPEQKADFAAGRIVMGAPSMNGKTHLSRWLTHPPEEDDAGLRKPIDEHERTWGFDRYVTTLTPAQHQQDGLGDVRLTVIDCGGRREQVRSHHNLVYMESLRTIFVVCLRNDKTLGKTGGILPKDDPRFASGTAIADCGSVIRPPHSIATAKRTRTDSGSAGGDAHG